MSTRTREADWITVEEATARILECVQPLDLERVKISEAVGRVLVSSISSPIDHPPWDNSAMDGFAARTADVRGASRNEPVRLRVVESVPAGGFPSRPIAEGEAVEIMTGAPIPEGADCVVRVEHTRREGDRVVVVDDMDAGRNVRPKGEDVRAGEVVLEAGRVLRPAEIALLATVGCATVEVRRRPHIAILSTGDELADFDEFDDVLAGRKIANSNSYGLAAAVRAAGAEPEILGIARDDRASLREHLERALPADALVTTAGASVGEHDLVKDALEDVGMRLAFWRVQMRPGSPFSFGLVPRPDRAPLLVFSLPGNPVSALVTFEVLVRPALRRMSGQRAALSPRTVRVRAVEAIASKPDLVHYLRVKLSAEGAGGWLARLTGPQGSGLITSMTEADALLVVPLGKAGIEAGELADAIPLRDEYDLEPLRH